VNALVRLECQQQQQEEEAADGCRDNAVNKWRGRSQRAVTRTGDWATVISHRRTSASNWMTDALTLQRGWMR